MRKREASWWIAAALLTLAAKPVSAIGRIVDEAGRPISGAEVCAIVAGGSPGICARSRDDGSYDLPGSDGDVRIVVGGYLPRTIGAVAQAKPIVLARAAALRVRLVDRATGAAPATAAVDVVYSTGRKLGAFPANASGLSLPTLPAGEARIVARSPGYKDASSDVVHLEAGQETEAILTLDASDAKPGK